MQLNINYLGKRKIPFTRNSFESVIKEIKATPLLVRRVAERKSIKALYYSYLGVFLAPVDAVYFSQYNGIAVIFADVQRKKNPHIDFSKLDFNDNDEVLQIQNGNNMFDAGGCGCFTDDDNGNTATANVKTTQRKPKTAQLSAAQSIQIKKGARPLCLSPEHLLCPFPATPLIIRH